MKLLLALAILVAACFGYTRFAAPGAGDPVTRIGQDASDSQVQGTGVVTRILSDDAQGSRHQRFIVRLSSGQTVLVAHNIDLAPRVPGLKVGDIVEFSGEFEWNDKGGVVHWTHHDPSGSHPGGWLKHGGRVFQ